MQDIVDSLAQCQRFLDQSADDVSSSSSDWRKFRLLLAKPGTGKSQVVIRAIHHAIQQEYTVSLVAPVALLAQGYRAIFGPDLDAETIHAAFHIPVNQEQAPDVNFALARYDMLDIDEASLVSPQTSVIASTLNHLTSRPLVVIARDKCQQQPLQTIHGRVSNCTSILNDDTFPQNNSVKHGLYQQFTIVDLQYARFLDLLRHHQPTQAELDNFQEPLVLYQPGQLQDSPAILKHPS